MIDEATAGNSLGEAMAELGIPPTTSRLYISLLRLGPQHGEQLRVRLQLPPRELEKALNQLLRLGLAGADADGRHKRYYAKDPELAWLAIVATLVWSARGTIGPVRALPATDNPDVDRRRVLCDRAAEAAMRLCRRHHDAVSHHRFRDAYSADELASLTCEMLYKARKEIVAASVTGPGRLPHVAEFWVVLQARMADGVKYRRVVDLQELIDHGLDIVDRDVNEAGVDLRVIDAAKIEHTFYIADGRCAALHDREAGAPANLSGRSETSLGRITNHHHIAHRYHKRFEQLYRRAVPAARVVAELRSRGRALLARAEAVVAEDEVAYLLDLIRLGKFTTLPREQAWPAQRTRDAMRALIDNDLARMNVHAELVPNYGLSDADIGELGGSAAATGS